MNGGGNDGNNDNFEPLDYEIFCLGLHRKLLGSLGEYMEGHVVHKKKSLRINKCFRVHTHLLC